MTRIGILTGTHEGKIGELISFDQTDGTWTVAVWLDDCISWEFGQQEGIDFIILTEKAA